MSKDLFEDETLLNNPDILERLLAEKLDNAVTQMQEAEVAQEIGTDMQAIWTPTATNCFKRLKDQQLDGLYKDLLDLHVDTDDYRAFAKSKKGEKNEAMHKLFSDPKHQKLCRVTAEQKARIDAWVPNCFE